MVGKSSPKSKAYHRMGIFQHRLSLSLASIMFVLLILMYMRLENELKAIQDERMRVNLLVTRLTNSETNSEKQIDTLDEFDDTSYVGPGSNIKANDETIIIYNRVPKTASTTLMGLFYDLCKVNKFNVIHLNISRNSHILSLSDQARFIHNITKWKEKLPAIYHGHVSHINFKKFGIQQNPLYINMIREPLDRLVSYYYFLRNGDDFRPYLTRKRQKDKDTSFDECVVRRGRDCDPKNMWLEIPFFCGHAAECWQPGNEWALKRAKENLINNYLLVGVTEQLREMVAILEATMPRFFKGASTLYANGKKSHLRKTFHKLEPLPETVNTIQKSKIWRMEHDFYEFTKDQFEFVKEYTLTNLNGRLKDRGKLFYYEKIRPRK